jgi:hypothetical protein
MILRRNTVTQNAVFCPYSSVYRELDRPVTVFFLQITIFVMSITINCYQVLSDRDKSSNHLYSLNSYKQFITARILLKVRETARNTLKILRNG